MYRRSDVFRILTLSSQDYIIFLFPLCPFVALKLHINIIFNKLITRYFISRVACINEIVFPSCFLVGYCQCGNATDFCAPFMYPTMSPNSLPVF